MPRGKWLTLTGLVVLLAVSAFLRTRALDAGYWIDEGISVGIASHGLLDIPSLLEQDGSPPLYYLLLAVWIDIAGSGESATHLLSLFFALASVPAALWAGRSLFGPRAGWFCAGIAALNPFLTVYAQETRMYSLAMLLSVVATAAYLRAFVWRERPYVLVFALALAALLYTHNWGLYFAAGALVALAPLLRWAGDRRALARDSTAAFGLTAVLYAPWVPSLLAQVAHTGAPWAEVPSIGDLDEGFSLPLGTAIAGAALLVSAGGGLVLVLRRGELRERKAAATALLLLSSAFVLAWVAAQFEPNWANRYLAVLVGPFLLLAGAGLARAGVVGLAAAVALGAVWLGYRAPELKSNVRPLAAEVGPALEPGDLVLSTQPEQVPALDHYLPDGLAYATPLGSVSDPRVMDWRGALSRLEAAPANDLVPILDRLPRGARALFVAPVGSAEEGSAPWFPLVLERSRDWAETFAADARFQRLASIPADPAAQLPVQAVLYEKQDW